MTLEVDVGLGLGSFTLDARFASDGRVTALFGPSGAGKTSLVNALAGLVRPDRGRIAIDGHVLFDHHTRAWVPPHRRGIGYVFQEGRLFPHLTVRQNLLYGRWFTPRAARREQLDDVVALLGIGALLHRRPGPPVGRREAAGRARPGASRQPAASAPGRASRLPGCAAEGEILPYIERLRDQTGIPMVYVSHSVAEVARLANTLVVLSDGRVKASGPVGEVMARLDMISLIGLEEAGAVLEARVVRTDAAVGLTTLRSAAGDLYVPHLDLPAGTPVRIRIRARDVMVATRAPSDLSALNVLEGTVAEVRAHGGGASEIRLDCGGEAIVARLTRHSVERLGLEPGRRVYAVVKAVAIDGHQLSASAGAAADAETSAH